MRNYADSTVAMTIYNLLCIVGRPMTVTGLLDRAIAQHPGIGEKDISRALAGLLARDRVQADGLGKYDLVAQHRLFVVQRDLSDYDYETMEGGWEGWQVKDPRIRNGVGTRPLEALLGQPLTGRVPRGLPPKPVVEETP